MTTRFSPQNPDAAVSPALRSFSDALMNCRSIDEIRALSPLPEDAQKAIDDAVTEVKMDRLVLVRDLMAAKLVYNLPDPLAVTELQWDAVNRVGAARRSMEPGTRGENKLIDRSTQRIPIYCTTDEFRLGVRLLRASQKSGAGLDTTMVTQVIRSVNESIEDAAWNGATTEGGTLFTANGNSAYGVLNHPDVNTFNFVGGEAWSAVGHTGEEILADMLGMIEDLINLKFYGPYVAYVTTADWMKLMQDFKSNSDITTLQRLQEIQTGSGPLSVRVADYLPADTVVLMEQSRGVMDMVIGQEPTIIQWESPQGFDKMFMALAIAVPRIKSDYNGVTGIIVGTPT
jgi:hypothetical protein